MVEEWRDIKGYEGMYQVSDAGLVRSLDREVNGKFLKGRILSCYSKHTYPAVVLCNEKGKKHVRVHRIVAETFLENPYNLPEVNHIDGNKNNNHVDNLEWCTHRENAEHAWRTGLTPPPPAEFPRKVEMYAGDYKLATFCSIEIVGQITRISCEDICKCCKGKRKTAGGYKWKYKEG